MQMYYFTARQNQPWEGSKCFQKSDPKREHCETTDSSPCFTHFILKHSFNIILLNRQTLKGSKIHYFSDSGSNVTVLWFKPTCLYVKSTFQYPTHPSRHYPLPPPTQLFFDVITSELEVLDSTPGSSCELTLFSPFFLFHIFGGFSVLASIVYSLCLNSFLSFSLTALSLLIYFSLFYYPHDNLVACALKTA